LEKNSNVKLFYSKNHKESELAFDFLKTNEIFFSAFDVEKYNLTHVLERDIGTVKIPTVVSSKGVFTGIDCIKSYLNER